MNFVYDFETYPNIITLDVQHVESGLTWAFEISEWRNDSRDIVEFCHSIADLGGRMVGYNSLGFDYPILHQLLRMGTCDAKSLYDKAMAIIGSFSDPENEDRFVHGVKPSDRIVPQVDLFKIHHFDNKAKSTSLKMLEFNMRSDSVEDLPFPVGIRLSKEQAVVLKKYNRHDVAQTKQFLRHSMPMIKFRDELMAKYPGKDWINFNDTKIGKEYFIMELEKAGVQCYEFGPEGRKPRQTKRPQIELKHAILPWLQFEQPEFNRVLNWLKAQTITETKGVFTDLTATINGFEFVFGLGGIHGSIESEVVESDDEFIIVDLDVSSYYPNLAIANGFYPYHLGQSFCGIYKSLYDMRKTYDKKSAENAMLKLGLNGVFGDSNNRFSVFYDPLYTMCITLNGQLQLCMLAEQLMKIPQLRLIQVNTDGLTVRLPRVNKHMVDIVRDWWQRATKLELEEAIYKTMLIRDVNSYLAVYEDGKVKRKGAYEWKTVENGGTLGWHQNHSSLVVPRVAEMALVEGAPIRQTIMNWPDKMDFMLRTKVPRSSKLVLSKDGHEEQLQNITRYYVAKGGGQLFKIMPPTKVQIAAGKTADRRIGVESGWGVQPANDVRQSEGWLPIDFEYYIRETEKLVMGLA